MAFENVLKEYNEKKTKALAMGSTTKLEQRKNDGILNARERISYLVDQDSL